MILDRIHIRDKRTLNVSKNIVVSAGIKTVGMACSFLLVPITLDYLSSEVYGIWLAITSVLMWFSFFDIGLGNGMRNYLSQAIAANDYDKGRKFISTTFAMLVLFAFVLAMLVSFVFPFVKWNEVLNTWALPEETLRQVVLVSIVFTLITFVLKNIGVIFIALQKYAINDFLVVGGNVLALLVIYVLTRTTTANLLYVTLAFTVSPVLVYLLAAIPLFIKYPRLRPCYSSVELKLSRKLIGKGMEFFFIQITSCLVIYGSSNVFISNLCGTEQVTVYNIAFKYFNLTSVAYIILISPLWSAYTEAYVRNDFDWIRNNFKRSLVAWFILMLLSIGMLCVSNYVFRFWVGGSVVVPFGVSLMVMIYVVLYNLNNCVTYVINGLNVVRVQIMTSFVATAFYLMIVGKMGTLFGVIGVVGSMATSYLLMILPHCYQCYLLINNKAKGIWFK